MLNEKKIYLQQNHWRRSKVIRQTEYLMNVREEKLYVFLFFH